jgi:hypothetical protein
VAPLPILAHLRIVILHKMTGPGGSGRAGRSSRAPGHKARTGSAFQENPHDFTKAS